MQHLLKWISNGKKMNYNDVLIFIKVTIYLTISLKCFTSSKFTAPTYYWIGHR